MTGSRLTTLQTRVLELLASLRPAWTLTGGGALVGFHTHHRTTRDLDLFFRGEATLGMIVDEARRTLESAGLEVRVLRTTPTFSQLDVRDGASAVVIALVADPTPQVEAPTLVSLGAAEIQVEAPHQLLVNKLCALLSRSELRDLVDVQVLLHRGGDLLRAVADCPGQDAGFSPLSFGWSLRSLQVERLGASLGLDDEAIAGLVRFRAELVARVIAAAAPTG